MRCRFAFALLAGLPLMGAALPAPAITYTVAAGLPRIRVQSDNIASIGYDERVEILEVEFRTGSVYQYYAVPKHIYQGLMNASSHGAYLAKYVKRGGYRYREVSY